MKKPYISTEIWGRYYLRDLVDELIENSAWFVVVETGNHHWRVSTHNTLKLRTLLSGHGLVVQAALIQAPIDARVAMKE